MACSSDTPFGPRRREGFLTSWARTTAIARSYVARAAGVDRQPIGCGNGIPQTPAARFTPIPDDKGHNLAALATQHDPRVQLKALVSIRLYFHQNHADLITKLCCLFWEALTDYICHL